MLKPSISSISLGRAAAGHSLSYRLDLAAAHGYEGLELFHEEILELCDSLQGGATPTNQRSAAATIRGWFDARGLAVVCLQPFMHYEGLLDRTAHVQRVQEFKLWLELADILHTDLILLPSSFLGPHETTGDLGAIVVDLQEVADLAAPNGVRLAYEALCWGTHTRTWERSWEVVRKVGRRNFGLCLDTFNICGYFADPADPTGFIANWRAKFEESMERLVAQVDVEKVFFVQLADAVRLEAPLREGHELYFDGQPSRMSWSRNCRLFYGERNRRAYLPVREVCEAIFKGLRFEGWVSWEVFNARLWDEGREVPDELAARSAEGWKKLLKDLGLTAGEGAKDRVGGLKKTAGVEMGMGRVVAKALL